MPPDPSTEQTASRPPTGSRTAPGDDVFEHYRILRREDGTVWELGHGAMGVTYKALDTNLGKPVALKIIHARFLDQETSRQRFRREARAAASLDHRHVARVYHLGQSGDNFFYAMEYIAGDTVEALVRRDGPLPWRGALAITLQISRALMAAHARNLVHRDIKPANIMVVDEVDERSVAKLIDFGLAKSAAEEPGTTHAISRGSGFLGTPLYASPEQCEELPADIRSDIYSLGITLWYMLTGHPTFEGNLARVFHQQLHADPPFDRLPADLPPAVRALLERMLAKDREERPQTPVDLRGQIEDCLQAPGTAPAGAAHAPVGPKLPGRAARPAGQGGRAGWLFVGLLVVLLAGTAGWSGWRWLRQDEPPPGAPYAEPSTPLPARRAVAVEPPAPRVLPASPVSGTPPPFSGLSELLAHARGIARTSDHAAAIEAYNAVLAAAPRTVEAWEEIGSACQALHEDDQARAAMRRAVAIPPADPRDSCYLGAAFLALNQPDDARQAFEAGLNFAPQDAHDHAIHGLACFWLKDYDRALGDFNELIRLDPGNATAYNDRGYTYGRLGQTPQALRDYDEAVRLDPGYGMAYHNRGIAYHQLKQYQRAIQDYDAAVRLEPGAAATYNDRCFAYASLKQSAPALQDYDRAIALDGKNPVFYENRAAAETACGDKAAADRDRAQAKQLRGS